MQYFGRKADVLYSVKFCMQPQKDSPVQVI